MCGAAWMGALDAAGLGFCREITKPLKPLGKAASLLLEILGLLCRSMVSPCLLQAWGPAASLVTLRWVGPC